ncbi:hypothetical protein AGMMS49525_18460 [Bacteroidia bacterium]|nr:hypothetical protein AGMMS49525_18460 [Bacteroidia bacterium]
MEKDFEKNEENKYVLKNQKIKIKGFYDRYRDNTNFSDETVYEFKPSKK